MTKDAIIGLIINHIHAEVRTIAPTPDLVAEGRAKAPERTSIVDRLVSDISKDNPDGLVALMEILNDHTPKENYPEVRLLRQWQNMSILDTPMDTYYVADLLFSKRRAGVTLNTGEIAQLSALSNPDYPNPWPAGYVQRQLTPAALQEAPAAADDVIVGDIHGSAPDMSKLLASLGTVTRFESPEPAILIGDIHALPTATDSDALADTQVDTPIDTVPAAPERVKTTPVASYQEKRGMIEDAALANGVAMLSGKEWRASKMPRTQAVLVADFDFSTIAKEGVGRAAYLLVGPTSGDDVRIELKSQSTSGSAGDKLPTSLLRLVNAAKSHSYGTTVVGVVGQQYFASEALSLAREVASRSSRIRLVEGAENFVDAVRQSITAVKAQHAAVAAPDPAATLGPNDLGYGV